MHPTVLAAAASANITAAGGGNGILILIALILFAVAGIVAWFVEPRTIWGTFIAIGLCLYMGALLIGG